MNRLRMGCAAVAFIVAACTAGGGGNEAPTTINPSGSHTPVTLTFWSNYTGTEYHEYSKAFDIFHQRYPWITVKSLPNLNDQKLIAAINSGTPPDVALSFSPDNIGEFCSTGAFTNLNPYIQQDKLDLGQFPKVGLAMGSYKTDQCALPALADAYGLYYNTDMFRKAGITSPPKTISELTADAKKLTVMNSDGSIKVAGFVPLDGVGQNYLASWNAVWGAQWFDPAGKSAYATDAGWAAMLNWQKELIDWYGYDKLQSFVAGFGDEFSSSNAFEVGKVAMMMDGEWRVSFIDKQHPELNYATAPFPTPDDQTSRYGAGLIGGDIVAIPKGSPHPAEAWLLVKFLTTDTQALVYLSNTLRNLPITTASATSPDIKPDPHFATFLKIYQNPNSAFPPSGPAGAIYQDLGDTFVTKWQAGNVSDLQSGLQQLAKQVDDQMSSQIG
jgi:multiple sugar transport system substrate-binding protein